jgi:2-dehydropantoate 2-reductase
MGITYAVLGTGALGGFYGARLQQIGSEVHFLLHSDYEQVSQHGLRIESPDGNFTLPQVYAYRDVAEMPRCDVVMVALKTTQNHLLSRLLPSVVKEDGAVLVLQNGLGIEPAVAEIVGDDRVIGGLCFLCSNKIAPGHIHHLDYKKITLGEYRSSYAPAGISDRMQQIAQDFEQAGIPIELAEDLLTARWKKLVWNIPFNGLSVVLNAETDAMMADAAVRSIAQALMQEVLQGATACGRAINSNFIDAMLDHTAQMKPYRTSMKLDYDSGRPLELEAIFGNPLRMAAQNGVELSRIGMLYRQLVFLDRRRSVSSVQS